jgi:CheY-like chemotaxis protein
MESVGRLAGGVAHDFNNMLGVILGHAELALLKMDRSSRCHDDLVAIRSAAERSASLTRQLLTYARKQTITPRVMNLNETISGMLTMLLRLIGEHIDLFWRPGADLWQVKADPSQIDQILANLCVNSRDAMGKTGRIIIETQNCTLDAHDCDHYPEALPGQYVRLRVSDDGHGMDQETLANIFEPFYTTKEVGKGTGLGLSTVFGIVKQNNGHINVDSEPGQGATFSIYLPRLEETTSPPPPEEAAVPLTGGRETILLVEDEPAILDLTAMILEEQGYSVLKANTPRDALQLANACNGEIHLLMTDVIMPEMNGWDLAKKLLCTYPHMKHLFMSGYTADVIAHYGVLDADVHFIQKPFSLTDMVAMVREVLDR